jgi:hypothetical protein
MGSVVERATIADDMAGAKQDTAWRIERWGTGKTAEAGNVRITVAVLRIVPD